MPELKTTTLPLLPLATGVVLPGMVVTIALESPEARAAVDASETSHGRLVMVPRLDERFARVGTIAKIEDRGELPSGIKVIVVRGIERGLIGTGVPALANTSATIRCTNGSMRFTVVRLKRMSRRSDGSQAPAALFSLEPFMFFSPWCAKASAFGLSALLPSYVGNQVSASVVKRVLLDSLQVWTQKAFQQRSLPR